jgi:hypothetical protein
MANNKSVLIGISFLLGVGTGSFCFSDYDLLTKFKGVEVRLSHDLELENSVGHRLRMPAGTILYYKSSYEEEDYLILDITVEGIDKISLPVSKKREKSVYFGIR